jgi:phytochrome-interacting factor 3
VFRADFRVVLGRSRPGKELAELLWDNDEPALRTTTTPFFQPFTCSAAESSTARELHIKRRHRAMDDDGLGAIIPVHNDAAPWLHCPLIFDDGDSDGTAPLPPEYCAGLLACPTAYSGLHAAPDPTPAAAQVAGIIARPPSTVAVTHTQPSAAAGSEGIVNFTFFSRPLQRPAPSPGTGTNPLESTSVAQAAASRLRNRPLFSDQRMAWLHPPINKQGPPRADTAVAPPPPAQPPPAATTDHRYHHHHVQVEAAAQQQHMAQVQAPDAWATPATVTTSSVSSGNGDHRPQARRSGHQQHTAECSVSPDEVL